MAGIFYDFNKVLSYNALFNFIIGERGVGKTYGAKVFAIKRFLKTGRQFAYIRRYSTELDEAIGTREDDHFFEQIKNEFEGHEFTVKKHKHVYKLIIDGQIAGYGMPLSVSNILKSSTFNKVDTLIFDEFIIDKGVYRYLRSEVETMLELVETIGRLRNNLRVLFLGNAISSTNPYFTYFNLTLPYGSDIKVFKKGTILVNYIKNLEYREVKKQSRFGQLVEGTKYAEYAIDNKFLRDSKWFIGKKGKGAKFFFIVNYGGTRYGVWIDYEQELLFISKDIDPNCPIVVALSPDDHDNSTVLIRVRNSSFFSTIIEHYRQGKLMFESQAIKNNFMEILNKYINY